jgi:heme oxygenase
MQNEIIQTLVKDLIYAQLYDTGALYESVMVNAYVNGNQVDVEIRCNDYIKYHVERLDLTNQIKDNTFFKQEMARLLGDYFRGEVIKRISNPTYQMQLSARVNVVYNNTIL